MNKNNFKRWGSVGLIAIMSTVFIFQNNSMIKKNAVISDLKTTQVVANTFPSLQDLKDALSWLGVAKDLWDEVKPFLIDSWNTFVDWADDGQYWCKCHYNDSTPCQKGHKFNYLRDTCKSVSKSSGSEPSCNDFNSNCNSNSNS